jgi:hypothetical protein
MPVSRDAVRYLSGAVGGETDAELLGRFIDRRDEGAFALLVRRHGPMVYGVCRRLLPTDQDAEDAFQATILNRNDGPASGHSRIIRRRSSGCVAGTPAPHRAEGGP